MSDDDLEQLKQAHLEKYTSPVRPQEHGSKEPWHPAGGGQNCEAGSKATACAGGRTTPPAVLQ